MDSYGIGNRGTFGDSYSALFFSWGRQLFSSVDAGLNLKVLSQSFHKWRNTGLGLDAGLLLAGNRRASLGLFFQNLVAPSFKFASDGLQDRFPTNLRIGFKFRVIPQVLVAGDYLMMDMMPYKEAYATGASTGDNRYFLGLEVSPVPFLSLGAGYNKRESGTGIRLRMRNFDFGYNWAVSGWGSSHRVGVTLRFGMLLSHQEKMLGEKAADLGEKEKAFLMREKDLMKREERADAIVGEVVARRLESAWLYVKEFKFKRAEEELWEVFRLDPENQEALKIKEGIKSGRLKADLPYAAAMQYYKNGEYRKALKNVKKALILHPEHKEAQYLEFMTRARIFLNRGEYKEAKKQALDAFKIFPDNTEVSTIIDGINDILKAKTGGE
ncbi:MAG TPA: hypothetical protein VJC03_01240 [bacterium]|nr:hypothetical protein [bacterium]